ncbi:hypothetical protein [Burkholderia sp. Bp8990]|uniref:hypothetical protein n=1 Tax=Burkholderia sp. Bp8990 TaxID=2184552 RepID=UPI000F5AED0B|nr:hypothetical protein [Burkholderia sp. Bp8990]RQS39790.1 hypothetical protein DIE01_16395 [Burkholderia sp. Bp8990]
MKLSERLKAERAARDQKRIKRLSARVVRAQREQPPGRVVPTPDEVDIVFGPVEQFLEQLAEGEYDVGTVDGREFPVMRDRDGELIEAIPNLAGWADYWQALGENIGRPVDVEPFACLIEELQAGKPEYQTIVKAKESCFCMRIIYRSIDVSVTRSQAITQQIKIELNITSA